MSAAKWKQQRSGKIRFTFEQKIIAMTTKTLLISSVLSGFLFFMAAGQCFADASEQLKQADDYKQNKQYEQAEAIYQQIVTDFPGTDDALKAQKELTLLYIITDSQQQADAAFEQLVTDFSEHTGISQAVWQIAKGYEQPKKYDKALELHQYNVQNFSPDKHAMWSQVEVVYLNINSGQNAAADTAFEKLITLFSSRPTLPKEIHQIAMRYNSLKRYDKALELHKYNAEHSSKDDMYTMWSQVEIVKSHIHNANDAAADAACDTLLDLFSEQPTLPKEVYKIADLYSKAGRNDKALDLHQYNVEHISKDDIYIMWSLVETVKSHIRNADDAAADAACDTLLSVFSEQPTLSKEVYQIADMYGKAGKNTKAGRLYQHVVDNWPKSGQAVLAQMNLAIYYVDKNDDLNAQAAVDKLIADFSQNPQITRAIHDVAQHYRLSGKHNKADQLDQYNVDNYSGDMYAMWSLVEIVKSHIRNANDAAADAAYDTLISKFSNQPTLSKEVYQIADLYVKAERYDKAFDLHQYNVEHISSVDIYTMWSLVEIIKSHIRNLDDDDADAACDILLAEFSQQPAFPTELYKIAMIYQKSGRPEKALQFHQYNIENSSKDDMYTMWSKIEIIKSHIRDANDAAAREAFDKLLSEFPDQPTLPKEVHQVLGKYANRGGYDKAVQLYRHMLEKWPEAAEHAALAQMGLAEINVLSLIDSGKNTEARQALDTLIADFNDHPDFAWTLDSIAARFERANKFGQARSIYRKIVADYNKTDSALTAQKKLAVLEIKAGDQVATQAALDTLIADFNEHPDLPEAVFVVGEQYYNWASQCKKTGLLAKEKDILLKTIAVWERIITDLSSSPITPQAYYMSARCYERIGQYEDAIDYYSIVVDNWPDYERAWNAQFLIARCFDRLARSGSIPRADAAPIIRQACEKLIINYPDSMAVGAALNLLKRWESVNSK